MFLLITIFPLALALKPFLDPLEYCSASGEISDTCCTFKTLDQVNSEILPIINQLTSSKFFRYHKTNLNKKCQFWPDDGKCLRKDCSVEVSDIITPPEWDDSFSDVDLSNSHLFPFSKCDYHQSDFCVFDDELSNYGVYVDLLANPERFTGYEGEASNRIWQAIYNDNCFKNDNSALTGELCLEKRVYHRVISGLHSSISTHICKEYYTAEKGWHSDVECFVERVGKHPDRLENMYFVYSLVLAAIRKLSPYLLKYDFCSLENETLDIHNLIEKFVKVASSCTKTFDESVLFTNNPSLKKEFMMKFRNVSRIMDCVSCEKCKLWGKLQVGGIGVALKVLFSFGKNWKTFKLTRGEIVKLLNGFGRLVESLEAREKFRLEHLEMTYNVVQKIADVWSF